MPAKREVPNADNLISRYLSGEATGKLLEEFGISECLLNRLLKDRGLTRIPKSRAYALLGDRKRGICFWTPENPQSVIDAFLEGRSVKALSEQLGVDRGVVSRFLNNNGIKTRTRSEAELLKWSEIKKSPDLIKRQLGRAWEVSGAADDELEKSILDAYQSSTAVSKRTLAKSMNTSVGNVSRILRKNCIVNNRQGDRHACGVERTRTQCSVSAYEIPIIDALVAYGENPIHQKAIGSRNVDIAFPELHVIVELERGTMADSKSLASERLENFFNAGWRLLVVYDSRKNGIDAELVAQKIITFLNVFRAQPATAGQYGVIGRHGQTLSKAGAKLNRWARIEGF